MYKNIGRRIVYRMLKIVETMIIRTRMETDNTNWLDNGI